MEILGIGPGEFFFILIILLVVVGPERLPDLARRAGQLLVRGRNWLQSSPDAAMVLRARQEIEQELANIRSSLMEVQSVRDEVLGAAKQIGAEVNSLTSITKTELDSIGSLAPKLTVPATQAETATDAPLDQAADAEVPPATDAPLDQAADAEVPPATDAPATELLDGAGAQETADLAPDRTDSTQAIDIEQNGTAPAEPASDASQAISPDPAVPQLRQPRQPVPQAPEPELSPYHRWEAQTALESIDVRLQAIMADLFALQEQLKQRGALADDWQPPSWGMQLPATTPDDYAAPDEPSSPAEPVETEEAPNVQ